MGPPPSINVDRLAVPILPGPGYERPPGCFRGPRPVPDRLILRVSDLGTVNILHGAEEFYRIFHDLRRLRVVTSEVETTFSIQAPEAPVMRSPRLRFTIRRLMTVVGIVGLGLGVLRAIDRYFEFIEPCLFLLFIALTYFFSY